MYGATAGEVCLLGEAISTNQACCGLIPKKWTREYLFVTVREARADLASKATGSAQQNLSQKLISNHKTLLASQKVIQAYSEITSSLIEQWIANEQESYSLAQTRDLLLPKLMSGEIRIRDAEIIMEQVA